MSIHNLFKFLTSTFVRRPPARRGPPTRRPSVEPLEDRWVPNFSPAVSYPVDLSPSSVATADFNADGRLDLAVANVGTNTVSVLLGNGDGTFQPARTSGTGFGPGSVMAGDLNGDGKTDLVTAAGDLSVLLGKGDGTFQPPQTVVLPGQVPPGYTGPYPLGQSAMSAALGDLNGDGKLDLVATGSTWYDVLSGYDDYGNPIYFPRSDVYLNVLVGNGDGTFDPGTTDHDIYAGKVELGDFNNDGRLDAAYDGGASLSVRLGNGDGTLQAVQRSYVSAWFYTNVNPVGDFNGDAKLDLLMVDGSANGLLLLRGNGDGTFQGAQKVYDGTNHSVVVGDVNGDGNLDVVSVSSNYDADYIWTSSASVLPGNGDGSFAAPIISDLGVPQDNYFSSTVLADFDGDGHVDLAGSAAPPALDYDYQQGFVALSRNSGNWTPPPPPPPPSMGIADMSVSEGNTGTRTATFMVCLTKSWDQPVTVVYATANGTATAGSDYHAASGTLTIPAGQTTGTITVLVNGDRVAEPNETFFVNLSCPTNATIADGQGVGTIVDDEPRIGISDVSKKEGKKGQKTQFTFTVTLSAAYDQPVSMSFKTTDGTAKTSDQDYVAKSGALTFAAGETTKTITITVNGDSKKEADETFYLDLFGNSSNSLFTKNRGTGTILNDD
jgi:hypothetical protein